MGGQVQMQIRVSIDADVWEDFKWRCKRHGEKSSEIAGAILEQWVYEGNFLEEPTESGEQQ